jgi:tetratricopeptide (TPR) repeat protein
LAKALEWLANAHRQAGNLEKAGPLYKRALEIWQNPKEPGHPKVGKILNSLGNLYQKQGRYGEAEAEDFYTRALAIREKALGPDHPSVAKAIADYGRLRLDQGKNDETAPLFKRPLRVQEKALGPEYAPE